MRLALILACCGAWSCGYVGEPLPPALNIAAPIVDLRAVEYGSLIVVDFTIPSLTTEGMALQGAALANPGAIDLRAGVATAPFDENRWAESARKVPVRAVDVGPAHASLPASAWAGQEIVIGVRLINQRGRPSSWSNLVSLRVVPPLGVPRDIVAASAERGARIAWKSAESEFRVYRRGPEDREPVLLGSSKVAEYVDATARFGIAYEYRVQAARDRAESEISAPIGIVPRDEFPPATPSGLHAAAGIGSIELVWEPNADSDLKGYRVYRGAGAGALERIAEFVDMPAYSDRQVDAAAKYRYAVAAIDHAGNESKMTAAVEIAAP